MPHSIFLTPGAYHRIHLHFFNLVFIFSFILFFFISFIFFSGPVGCGKTALAVQMALNSDFPFVKMCSPENMIGFIESAKCQTIKKVKERSCSLLKHDFYNYLRDGCLDTNTAYIPCMFYKEQ